MALKKVKVFPGSRKVPSKFTSWDYSLLIVSTVKIQICFYCWKLTLGVAQIFFKILQPVKHTVCIGYNELKYFWWLHIDLKEIQRQKEMFSFVISSSALYVCVLFIIQTRAHICLKVAVLHQHPTVSDVQETMESAQTLRLKKGF